MSKAAKQSILILVILLAGGLAFAGYTLLEKQNIEQQRISLERELLSTQDREKKNVVEVKGLKDQLEQEKAETFKYKSMIEDSQKRVEELLAQMSQVTGDRDKWQARLEDIKKERDELLGKVKELTAKAQEKPQVVYQEKIVYKEREPAPAGETQQASGTVPSDAASAASLNTPVVPSEPVNTNEKYVAQILREKTALEVEMDKLKSDLSKRSLEIVDLKQANEALRIDLDSARQEKQNIADAIQEKEEMINRLSLELARAKNDKQFVAQKVDQMTQKNAQLREDIKKLSAAKVALEKSIVQVTQDKDSMNKKLEQAEVVLQNKIGEIWEVKDSLDRSVKVVKEKSQAGHEVELTPIIVQTQGEALVPTTDTTADSQAVNSGFEGKVMSVNEQNNFVIVDIGAKRGLRNGDTLGVYRGSEYLARLEVIQVRPDIAAADLKEKWAQIQIGDIVR